MKKLVAQAPRVAALVEYQDRAVADNEVKIRVRRSGGFSRGQSVYR
ncbi:Zinc-type alcohol dehydrogenase YcjQ [Cronobacter sakazakii 701]|nr:Zinc-type alcohol dehydrogenase YcjQ [Cronobacter sakazakii 701]